MKNRIQLNTYHRVSKSASLAGIAFLAIAVLSAPSISAGPKPKKPVARNLGVIAHVELDGGTASRMVLIQKKGRQYLYVGLGSSSGVCILDVTSPGAPRRIERVAGTIGEQTADLQRVGDTLAVMSRAGGSLPASSNAEPRAVTILNTTDPSNPTSIQTFSGVTSVVTDDDRGLIYLSNGEGLWIVQAKQPEKLEPVDNYS